MPEKLRNLLGGSAAMLLGTAAFFVFAGWWVLIPTNISWLNHADRAMHTLGWFFYRDSPWTFPPGASPGLGLELANSIALVDGLPLFAIPLKLLGPWLPHPFQYWGDWWLCCFILQSLFGYGFARQLGASRLVALLAAGFALITPAFLFRLPLHMALAGHWTILVALYLYARRAPPSRWMWPLLVGVTAVVHAYLLAMVAAVWFASLVQRLWLRRLPGHVVAIEVVVTLALTLVLMWLAGFFMAESSTAEGFGFLHLNLLGPILTYGIWSRLVPSLLHGRYDYEGLSFLGAGIFALLALGLVTGALSRLQRLFGARWLPLLVVAVLLAIGAMFNRIGIFDLSTQPIPLPSLLEYLGETFRSTGRFVWPLLYVVTIGAVVLLGRRLQPAWAVPILVVAFAAQIVDSQPGWSIFRTTIAAPSASFTTPLVSPFWDRAAAAGYTRVRVIPMSERRNDWQALETYAYTHRLETDAVYLGRYDAVAMDKLQATDNLALATGDFEPHTLYLLDAASAARTAQHIQPADLFAVVDHRIVFARNGASLVQGLGIDPHSALVATPWIPPVY